MVRDEMKGGVHLQELVDALGLAVLNRGEDYDTALVGIMDVNRPGLQLVGYYDYFDPRRLQVIGMAENKMLEGMDPEKRLESFQQFFSYDIPALVVSRDLDVYPECLAMARKCKRTLLHTADTTVMLTSRVIEYLSQRLAPTTTRHGVLLDIFGEGVMITGESGIGKSETAIELVKRGHRLIADDAVEIRKVSSRQLVGNAPEVLRHYIELRGIGVINVAKLFGMGAVKDSCNIDLIINMVPWRDGEAYDRLGIETQYTEILDVKVPSITIPITPGRNLAVIFEVAAINNRQKRMGYNAAMEFTEQMSKFFANKDD